MNDETVIYPPTIGYTDNRGSVIWDKCPSCGGKLYTYIEYTTAGPVTRQRCVEGKTSGCLY
jgi:hypothetical protein